MFATFCPCVKVSFCIVKEMLFLECFIGLLHLSFIALTTMGWLIHPPLFILVPIVGLSWEWNDNFCLLTQLEEKCLGRAVIPGHITVSSRMLLWAEVALFIYVHHM